MLESTCLILGQFRPFLDDLEPFWIGFEPFRTVSDGFGSFSDSFRSFSDCFDRFEPFSDASLFLIFKFQTSIGQGQLKFEIERKDQKNEEKTTKNVRKNITCIRSRC